MSLTLHAHPLSSFCQKALIALYESGIPFAQARVDLGDPRSRAAFLALWPIGKMPVLEDAERGNLVPEATIIIEYLAGHYPEAAGLVPADPDLAWRVRLQDRFFDHYLQYPMQKIVVDRLRPPEVRDAHGVAEARILLRTAYGVLERHLAGRQWAAGDGFTMADCAAAPALYYADLVAPLGPDQPATSAYFRRLLARPSVARAVAEAEPYRHLFPQDEVAAPTG